MIDPYTELASLPPKIGSKTDAADVEDAIRWTDAATERSSSGHRAAQVSETAGWIYGGLEIGKEVCRNGFRELRDYKVSELGCFHGVNLRGGSGLPQPFKGGEEKGPVLEDGAAHCVTVLVLADIGYCGREHIARGKRTVLVVVRQRTVELVGAPSGDHLNSGPCTSSFLRRKVVRHHSDFLQGLGIRDRVDRAVIGVTIVAGIVYGVGVRLQPLSTGVNHHLGFACKGIVSSSLRTHTDGLTAAYHSRLESDQVERVAALQGQLIQLDTVYLAGYPALLGFEQRRPRVYRHLFGNRSHRQIEIGLDDLGDIYHQAFQVRNGEAGFFGGDVVPPGGQVRDPVEALARSLSRARDARRDIRGGHHGIGDRSLRRIDDGTLNSPGELSRRLNCSDQKNQTKPLRHASTSLCVITIIDPGTARCQ